MKRPSLIEIYRTGTLKNPGLGDWRWRIRSSNGRIIGASTEGYARVSVCAKNFTSITGIALDYNQNNVAGETTWMPARGVSMWAGQVDLRRARETSAVLYGEHS